MAGSGKTSNLIEGSRRLGWCMTTTDGSHTTTGRIKSRRTTGDESRFWVRALTYRQKSPSYKCLGQPLRVAHRAKQGTAACYSQSIRSEDVLQHYFGN